MREFIEDFWDTIWDPDYLLISLVMTGFSVMGLGLVLLLLIAGIDMSYDRIKNGPCVGSITKQTFESAHWILAGKTMVYIEDQWNIEIKRNNGSTCSYLSDNKE